MTLDQSNAPLTKHGTPPVHEPAPGGVSVIRLNLLRVAEWGVTNQAHYVYTQTALRSQMFNTKPFTLPADGKGLHADCSQFYAAATHWVGLNVLDQFAYTGTIVAHGKQVTEPRVGDCVIWGGGTGEHAAMYVGDGYTIGFGHSPGAPNRVSLANMDAYFKSAGHPGTRFYSFTA